METPLFLLVLLPSHTSHKINTDKLKIDINASLSVSFIYEVKDFAPGLKRLVLLLKQQDKIALNKKILFLSSILEVLSYARVLKRSMMSYNLILTIK